MPQLRHSGRRLGRHLPGLRPAAPTVGGRDFAGNAVHDHRRHAAGRSCWAGGRPVGRAATTDESARLDAFARVHAPAGSAVLGCGREPAALLPTADLRAADVRPAAGFGRAPHIRPGTHVRSATDIRSADVRSAACLRTAPVRSATRSLPTGAASLRAARVRPTRPVAGFRRAKQPVRAAERPAPAVRPVTGLPAAPLQLDRVAPGRDRPDRE